MSGGEKKERMSTPRFETCVASLLQGTPLTNCNVPLLRTFACIDILIIRRQRHRSRVILMRFLVNEGKRSSKGPPRRNESWRPRKQERGFQGRMMNPGGFALPDFCSWALTQRSIEDINCINLSYYSEYDR